MDLDTLEKVMGVMEGGAVVLAAIIAGLWALYTFRLRRQAVLSIVIRTSENIVPNDGCYLISAVVEIENKGTRNTRLPYEQPPLTVWRITFDEEGKRRSDFVDRYPVTRASNPDDPTPATIVRAGAIERIPFLLRLESRGLYLLTFVAGLSEAEVDVARTAGTPSGRGVSWVGKNYVIVE